MLNQRLAVVRTVTEGLVELEKHLDAALVAHGRLQIDAIEGRRSAYLPLDTGQAGLDKLAEATALIMAARKTVHEAHYAFRDVRHEMRLPVHAYGDTGDTPDSFTSPRGAISPTLAVANAA